MGVFDFYRRNLDICRLGDQVLDDLREVGAGVGQAVEVVLTLAAGGDDATVTEQCEVMADSGLTLAELCRVHRRAARPRPGS